MAAVRFAIKTMPEHTTWQAMLDVWRAADDIDLFESARNWDHFYPLTRDHAGANFEGWTMIAAMAQATRRIRVGCQVTGMIYRHPAVLANPRDRLRPQSRTRRGRARRVGEPGRKRSSRDVAGRRGAAAGSVSWPH